MNETNQMQGAGYRSTPRPRRAWQLRRRVVGAVPVVVWVASVLVAARLHQEMWTSTASTGYTADRLVAIASDRVERYAPGPMERSVGTDGVGSMERAGQSSQALVSHCGTLASILGCRCEDADAVPAHAEGAGAVRVVLAALDDYGRWFFEKAAVVGLRPIR